MALQRVKMNVRLGIIYSVLLLLSVQPASVFAQNPKNDSSDLDKKKIQASEWRKRILKNVRENDFQAQLETHTQLYSLVREIYGQNYWWTVTERESLKSIQKMNALNKTQQEQIIKARRLGKQGFYLHGEGNFKPALPYYRAATDIYSDLLGEKDIITLSGRASIVSAQTYAGLLTEAEINHKKYILNIQETYTTSHPQYADALGRLAMIRLKSGNLKSAEKLSLQALDIYVNSDATRTLTYLWLQANLVKVYLKNKSFEKAEKVAKQYIQQSKQLPLRERSRIWKGQLLLARSYSGQKRHAEATETAEEILDELTAIKPRLPAFFMVTYYEGYADVLFAAGYSETAAVFMKRVNSLQSEVRKNAEAMKDVQLR